MAEQKKYRNPAEYPAGIFDFQKLRKNKCLYVDKTDLIYQLAQSSFVFLSRPRRFGKSLLCTTLKYYFQGRRDLFEGLAIENLETEWLQYPVLHFSISSLKDKPIEMMPDQLGYMLREYEAIYGTDGATTPGMRLQSLIRRAHQQTGLGTVVIIDEYDAPMLTHLHDPERMAQVRRIMQEFYQSLKECDADERFVFITGITKFSQLSIFSTINNLSNITMDRQYNALCGISESELHQYFTLDIEMLAEEYEMTPEAMTAELKRRFDGYHFARKGEDIYNPYSLIRAFFHRELQSYWFASGTPTFIIEELRRHGTDLLKYDGAKASASEFDQPTEALTNPLPLLYQAGYLTIKDYRLSSDTYTLGLPNAEVGAGLMENVLPMISGTNMADNLSYATVIRDGLATGDTDRAMQALQSFLTSIPYMQQGKDQLGDLAKLEALYQRDLYVFFRGMGANVNVEVMMATGRVDMVMVIGDYVYVMEFKVSASAQSALDQIDRHKYYEPWRTVQRQVLKCGVRFDVTDRTLKDWQFLPVE